MAILNESAVAEKTKRDNLKISVDPIHSGLRLAVLGSFFGVGVLTFGAGLILVPNGTFLTILISGASAAGASVGIERYLKNKWPSGREFLADKERIAIAKRGKIEAVVDATQQVNVLAWRFEVKKDSPRAKKGWHLLGLAFEQEDNTVIIYSAASPEDFKNMPLTSAFTRLEKPKNDKKTTLSSAGGVRLAGQQKRLYQAELIRQLMGGDMPFEQFVETIEFLQDKYPDWMITD